MSFLTLTDRNGPPPYNTSGYKMPFATDIQPSWPTARYTTPFGVMDLETDQTGVSSAAYRAQINMKHTVPTELPTDSGSTKIVSTRSEFMVGALMFSVRTDNDDPPMFAMTCLHSLSAVNAQLRSAAGRRMFGAHKNPDRILRKYCLLGTLNTSLNNDSIKNAGASFENVSLTTYGYVQQQANYWDCVPNGEKYMGTDLWLLYVRRTLPKAYVASSGPEVLEIDDMDEDEDLAALTAGKRPRDSGAGVTNKRVRVEADEADEKTPWTYWTIVPVSTNGARPSSLMFNGVGWDGACQHVGRCRFSRPAATGSDIGDSYAASVAVLPDTQTQAQEALSRLSMFEMDMTRGMIQ